MDKEVTDFPEPDSPTIPIVSPRLRVKLISFTARVNPSSVLNSVTKFFTSNSKLFWLMYVLLGPCCREGLKYLLITTLQKEAVYRLRSAVYSSKNFNADVINYV